MSSRDSKLTLSLKQDITKRSISSDVSIHLKDAAPHQLQLFIDSLKTVEASFASPRGKNYVNRQFTLLGPSHVYCIPQL